MHERHPDRTHQDRSPNRTTARPGPLGLPIPGPLPTPTPPDGLAAPRPTDERALDARVGAGPDEYRFGTAAGVASPDAFRDAELRLVESLWDRDLGRLLVAEANYGVVGTVLAARADAVTMATASARAAALCARNAERNGAAVEAVVTADYRRLDATFDAAAYAPRAYTPLAVGKTRIAAALSVLRPGGSLFLAASKRAGLGRYEDHLADRGVAVEDHGARDGCHLLEATRPRTVDPPAAVTPRRFAPTVDGVDLSLRSVPGLFSHGELDAGTRLLLATADPDDGDRVLDLCCGAGPVGAYAARAADCEVVLTDDDALAAACARWSLDASGAGATVRVGDGTHPVGSRRFDHVLSNPPTHAGSDVLAALLAGARDVLVPGGRFTLVHHRDLDLRRYCSGFDRVERAATGREHAVLTATR